MHDTIALPFIGAYARKAKVELPPLEEYERQHPKFTVLPKPTETLVQAVNA